MIPHGIFLVQVGISCKKVLQVRYNATKLAQLQGYFTNWKFTTTTKHLALLLSKCKQTRSLWTCLDQSLDMSMFLDIFALMNKILHSPSHPSLAPYQIISVYHALGFPSSLYASIQSRLSIFFYQICSSFATPFYSATSLSRTYPNIKLGDPSSHSFSPECTMSPTFIATPIPSLDAPIHNQLPSKVFPTPLPLLYPLLPTYVVTTCSQNIPLLCCIRQPVLISSQALLTLTSYGSSKYAPSSNLALPQMYYPLQHVSHHVSGKLPHIQSGRLL